MMWTSRENALPSRIMTCTILGSPILRISIAWCIVFWTVRTKIIRSFANPRNGTIICTAKVQNCKTKWVFIKGYTYIWRRWFVEYVILVQLENNVHWHGIGPDIYVMQSQWERSCANSLETHDWAQCHTLKSFGIVFLLLKLRFGTSYSIIVNIHKHWTFIQKIVKPTRTLITKFVTIDTRVIARIVLFRL